MSSVESEAEVGAAMASTVLLSELGTYLRARCERHRCVLPAVRDADARVALGGAQLQLVVRHAAQYLLHHDPPDHAREVGAEATVDAQAEGRMPVRRAIELDLLRLVEQLRGQVGRRPRDPDPVVLTQRLATELAVSRNGPRHTLHRRHPPEVLLAGQRQPAEVLDQEP